MTSLVMSPKTGNHYDARTFLYYLTTNPDKRPNLGPNTVSDMMIEYRKGSNETPLDALEHVAAPTKIQQVIANYWAGMAYVDIGHSRAEQAFEKTRPCVPPVESTEKNPCIDYANLDSLGIGAYKVIRVRQPKYYGANIIPLNGTGPVSIKVTVSDPFSATLAVKLKTGGVSYTTLVGGIGQVMLRTGDSASLIIVNTPDSLTLYDGFKLDESPAVLKGLDYKLIISRTTA